MENKLLFALVCLFLISAAAAFATDVVTPGATPSQVVAARKLAMGANGALAGDMQAKLTAGNVKQVAADARAMAAIAALMPLVFTETYTDVYPVQGSKFFFKEGAAEDFAALAGGLNTAAEALAKIAESGDRAAASAQFGKIGAACGACHGEFRGQY
jgi:cytochrome c556